MTENYHNYVKFPVKRISDSGRGAFGNPAAIVSEIGRRVRPGKFLIVADLYTEADENEIIDLLAPLGAKVCRSEDAMLTAEEFREFAKPYLTDDRVFGIMNTRTLSDILVPEKVEAMRDALKKEDGLCLLIGVGASLIASGDLLIYGSVTRWEIQCRFAKGLPNFGSDNPDAPKLAKFKEGYFLNWRMADRHKKTLYGKIDYLLDTTRQGDPRMITGENFLKGLARFGTEPFRLVPYFAPEVWGGQWMKEHLDLDPSAKNYAWAFDGVPEENSVAMAFGDVVVEIPAADVVFTQPENLLGERVYGRFGDEFPIRFDFLDTMGGQNLSLQVHPLTEYIQNTFGMHYTQDESYYILDCKEGSYVCLGLLEGVDPEAMIADLKEASAGGRPFEAEKYVNRIPVHKHDHFLIPAGTVHCSGRDTMVLEISATPYIFTFKLWDWGRLGLDGLPRPTHIGHGEKVIRWNRQTGWILDNCVNRFQTLSESGNCRIVRTGLHPREFIETLRYEVCGTVLVENNGSVNMCNLVEGEKAVIASPDGAFGDFEVHYAETFIIPGSVDRYEIRTRSPCMILRATVR